MGTTDIKINREFESYFLRMMGKPLIFNLLKVCVLPVFMYFNAFDVTSTIIFSVFTVLFFGYIILQNIRYHRYLITSLETNAVGGLSLVFYDRNIRQEIKLEMEEVDLTLPKTLMYGTELFFTLNWNQNDHDFKLNQGSYSGWMAKNMEQLADDFTKLKAKSVSQ